MSLYNVGCMVPVRGHALEKQAYRTGMVGVGALVATPSFILEQIRSLDAEVMSHDREIAREAGLPGWGVPDEAKQQWWHEVWLPFVTEWSRFRNSHDSWADNLWGAVLDSVAVFRSRLIDLRKSAEQHGFSFGVPTPRPPEEGWMAELGHTIQGVGKFVKNVVYVLLALVGGVLVYKFFLLRRS